MVRSGVMGSMGPYHGRLFNFLGRCLVFPQTWNLEHEKKHLTERRRWVLQYGYWGRDQDAKCSSQVIRQVMLRNSLVFLSSILAMFHKSALSDEYLIMKTPDRSSLPFRQEKKLQFITGLLGGIRIVIWWHICLWSGEFDDKQRLLGMLRCGARVVPRVPTIYVLFGPYFRWHGTGSQTIRRCNTYLRYN